MLKFNLPYITGLKNENTYNKNLNFNKNGKDYKAI